MKLAPYAVLAALFLSACSRDINNKEALDLAMKDYMEERKQKTGLDMSKMNVEMTSVSFDKNTAKASVSFKPKDSTTAGMVMNYKFERRGNKWVCLGTDTAGHGGQGAGAAPAPTAPSGGMEPVPPGKK